MAIKRRVQYSSIVKETLTGTNLKMSVLSSSNERGLSFPFEAHRLTQVSKNDILGITPPLPAPAILYQAHQILESGDEVRLVKASPQPADDRRTALGEHIDFGASRSSSTGSAVCRFSHPRADAQWVYVRPLPEHAIVKLGDAIVKFTNGLYRSNIHSVAPPPDPQADCTRYSLVYFSRPEDDVVLKRLERSDWIRELEAGEVEEVVNSKRLVYPSRIGDQGQFGGD